MKNLVSFCDTIAIVICFVYTMDALLDGLSISAKKELQSLCCMMGKRCLFDVIFWLSMFGDELIEYRTRLNSVLSFEKI